MTEVELRTRCYPTEDRAKVSEAIRNIFPDAQIHDDDPLTATSSSIERFAEILLNTKIRSAARAVLRRSVEGNSVRFSMNKQVATVGKVSFSEERHPLGDIEVVISSDDIERLIDEIAPPIVTPESKVRT